MMSRSARPHALSPAIAPTFLTALCIALAALAATAPPAVAQEEERDPLVPTPQEEARVEAAIAGMEVANLHDAQRAAVGLTSISGPYCTLRMMELLQSGIKIELGNILAEALEGRLAHPHKKTRKKLWEIFQQTCLREKSTEVQERLVRSADGYPEGREVSDFLIKFMRRAKNDEVRVAVIDVVGELGEQGAVDFLESQARSKFGRIRKAAVWALYNHDEETAVDLTVRMLERDSEMDNRRQALLRLDERGSDHAEHIARAMVADQSWYVRVEAVQALSDDRIRPVLDAYLKTLLHDDKEDVRVKVPDILTSFAGEDDEWHEAILTALRTARKREGNRDVLRAIDAALRALE